ncbi:MAG: hypothetical protein H6659_04940 [Ardenticatenaceae bacterium]|nr:hypothetical protein [Ardenticatenaceae bacterium]
MSVTTHLLQRAAQLLVAGKVEDARRVITAVLEKEPANADAWYLWQQTLPDTAERTAILQKVLRLDPDHAEARQALADIRPEAAPPVLVETKAAAEEKAQLERYQLAALALGAALITVFACLVYFMVMDSSSMQSLAGRYKALEQKYETAVTAINNLTNRNETLQSEKQQVQSQYAQLDSQHDTLTAQHNQLQKVYAALQTEFAALQTRYDELAAEYEALNGRYAALQQEHNTLVTTYNNLSGQYTNLQAVHNQTTQENEWLQRIGVFPPYIRVTGERNVELVFYRSDSQLNRWDFPMDALAQDIVRGNHDRNSILKAIFDRVNLEGLEGSAASAPDFREFVDPSPFYAYVRDIYYDSPNEYAFIYELWYITTQLSTYNREMKETPRYPLETFLAGGGDCEDTSILLASMLKAAPVNWRVSLVYLNGDHPYQRTQPNHIMVLVETPNRPYLIETTEGYVMEPLDLSRVEGWPFEIEG